MQGLATAPPLPPPRKRGRTTHLHKQNKFLKQVPNLLHPQYLTTVYLYNNELENIEGLEECINLESLYLQENNIKTIENIRTLQKLKKLFLGHNRISVVENLENNIHLEELYLEKQDLKKSDCICFDPRSVFALSASLHVLDVSGNNIRSIYCLMPLSALRILRAAKNKIKDVYDILETIQFWYYLIEANFAGNPVTKKHRYRELIIGQTMRLNMLDGKQISPMTRTFIRNFEAERKKEKQPAVNLADAYPGLPTNYPKALQEAASTTIIKAGLSEMKLTTTHIPWKHFPKRAPAKKDRSAKRFGVPAKSTIESLFPMNL